MVDCTNINLKKGSTGEKVTQIQTILKQKGYYTGKIDGNYGAYTVEAVKKYQKDNNLLTDGIVGPVTCKKLQETTTNTNKSYYKNGKYVSSPHWISKGCNRLGQCNGYYCAPHSIRQCNSKQDIDQYTEATIAGWAGTTSAGTSHQGIETAVAQLAKKINKKIQVQWKHFSEMGTSRTNRWKKIGELISKQDTGVIFHVKYRNQWGHYETIKEVNMNNNTIVVLNSLGSKCGSPAYCGTLETRSFATMESYIKGISQKSVCIITYQ